ncbi:MAG: hypothetical protein EOS17_30765 [Mesorhizobium sp.]|nr:MAG: hypothetical protein EOS17_30765 [Mesorhizobium sp.]
MGGRKIPELKVVHLFLKAAILFAPPRSSTVCRRAAVVQQNTGRPVQFELMSDARSSLLAWLERRGRRCPGTAEATETYRCGSISEWSRVC